MAGSHNAFENELSNLTRLDQPLTSKAGVPVTRRQRKALESSANNSSLAGASFLNSSATPGSSARLSASGGRRLTDTLKVASTGKRRHLTGKTPEKDVGNILRTPAKSPGRLDRRTPGSSSRKKGVDGSDRFIPSRSGTNFETARFLLLRDRPVDGAEESPSKLKFQRQMAENLHGTADFDKARIISYRSKPAEASAVGGLRLLQSNSPMLRAKRAHARNIPQAPDRILDAPEMVNDYYLNLLDWSASNFLAVALGSQIYLWNASSGTIQLLVELEAPEDYVCSVKWVSNGNTLAVGNSCGDVTLWDAECGRCVRKMDGHSDRIGCLSWNEHILTSGSRSGKIHHSDVRQANHLVSVLDGHTLEVCGLSWSPDGKMLASGGNDNRLNVWQATRGHVTETSPKFTLRSHSAAVKALAWCPWQPNILASGGGTADQRIRIWNTNNGSQLNVVDVKSQVCSLIWSTEYKELVSAHGYAHNEIAIWKYPTMTKTAELLGHTERVLHMSQSPDGSTIVSAGADETLRLWKCFEPDPNRDRLKVGKSKRGGVVSALSGHIR